MPRSRDSLPASPSAGQLALAASIQDDRDRLAEPHNGAPTPLKTRARMKPRTPLRPSCELQEIYAATHLATSVALERLARVRRWREGYGV